MNPIHSIIEALHVLFAKKKLRNSLPTYNLIIADFPALPPSFWIRRKGCIPVFVTRVSDDNPYFIGGGSTRICMDDLADPKHGVEWSPDGKGWKSFYTT